MIISNYWNSALRSLTKKKGFSAINIIGLAIGMAAALLILTYVAFEYSYDDMHSRADRIFRVEARFYENGELTDNWASSSAGSARARRSMWSAAVSRCTTTPSPSSKTESIAPKHSPDRTLSGEFFLPGGLWVSPAVAGIFRQMIFRYDIAKRSPLCYDEEDNVPAIELDSVSFSADGPVPVRGQVE